jgi:hypothetical protein
VAVSKSIGVGRPVEGGILLSLEEAALLNNSVAGRTRYEETILAENARLQAALERAVALAEANHPPSAPTDEGSR